MITRVRLAIGVGELGEIRLLEGRTKRFELLSGGKMAV